MEKPIFRLDEKYIKLVKPDDIKPGYLVHSEIGFIWVDLSRSMVGEIEEKEVSD